MTGEEISSPTWTGFGKLIDQVKGIDLPSDDTYQPSVP
jgi:hypothetical protein